ncbi:Double Zinc Ribbon And Ankyrin Repeat-Containing Protein 1 [Manis pentadactyla]|nr:Double Zinc Ribbon And Ankyrin Repeat-Containing Protein 1 [Manis pentadactyla]
MTFSDNCVHCLAPLPFGFEVAGYLDGCGEKQGLILSCRDAKEAHVTTRDVNRGAIAVAVNTFLSSHRLQEG